MDLGNVEQCRPIRHSLSATIYEADFEKLILMKLNKKKIEAHGDADGRYERLFGPSIHGIGVNVLCIIDLCHLH